MSSRAALSPGPADAACSAVAGPSTAVTRCSFPVTPGVPAGRRSAGSGQPWARGGRSSHAGPGFDVNWLRVTSPLHKGLGRAAPGMPSVPRPLSVRCLTGCSWSFRDGPSLSLQGGRKVRFRVGRSLSQPFQWQGPDLSPRLKMVGFRIVSIISLPTMLKIQKAIIPCIIKIDEHQGLFWCYKK